MDQTGDLRLESRAAIELQVRHVVMALQMLARSFGVQRADETTIGPVEPAP